MSEWISVNDRLPEDGSGVIVTFINHDPVSCYEHIKNIPLVDFACYSNTHKMWFWWSTAAEDLMDEYEYVPGDEIDEAVEVVAWMPKPEPFVEESHD